MEMRALFTILAVFLTVYFLPVGWPRFDGAVTEAFLLTRWYAREHVLLCLVPAFFVAGAIGVFLNKGAVMRFLGADANKAVAYGVASVGGTVLAVCSCTVLPLFAGIYRMGAGIGPASTFLYAGPAINVMAVVLTARILGFEMGVARTVGAVVFSIALGVVMHLVFGREDSGRVKMAAATPSDELASPPLHTAMVLGSLVGILIAANWAAPAQQTGLAYAIYELKWILTSACALVLAVSLVLCMGVSWFATATAVGATAASAFMLPQMPVVPFVVGSTALVLLTRFGGERSREWLDQTWDFAKQITPLLLAGVAAAGFLLGRPGHEGMIPSLWVTSLVGGNSLGANLGASIVGAAMYFATLTEVPIIQGLVGSGMGKGPALSLLLAGPALSIQSILVLAAILGPRRTAVYCLLVVVISALIGTAYGMFP